MGQIPTVERRVSPSGGEPFRTQQPDTSVAQALERFGGSLAGLGQTIGEIDEKVKQIQRTRQENQAQVEIQNLASTLSVSQSEEQDLDKLPRFNEDLDTGIADIINKNDDPIVREKVSFFADKIKNATKTEWAFSNIRKNDKRSQDIIDAAREKAIWSARNVTSDKQLMLDRALYETMLTSYGDEYNVPKDQITNSINKFREEFTANRVSADLIRNPELTISNLENDFYNVTDLQKKDFLDKARRVQNNLEIEANKEAIRLKDQKIDEFYSRFANAEDVTFQEVESAAQTYGMNKVEQSILEMYVSRTPMAEKSRSAAFAKIEKMKSNMFSRFKFFSTQEARFEPLLKEIKKEIQSGNISRDDGIAFLSSISKKSDKEAVDTLVDEAKLSLRLYDRVSSIQPFNQYDLYQRILTDLKTTGSTNITMDQIDSLAEKYSPGFKAKAKKNDEGKKVLQVSKGTPTKDKPIDKVIL